MAPTRTWSVAGARLAVAAAVLCAALTPAVAVHPSSLPSVWQQLDGLEQVRRLRGGDPMEPTASTTHMYVEATQDHFLQDVDQKPVLWQQRYNIDQSLWCGPACPVFLYIGGESPQGPVGPGLFMYDLAKKHQALVVSLEHRFYGVSYPVPDMSVENLRFLTSEQALADLAQFRNYLANTAGTAADTASSPPLTLAKGPLSEETKFVTFGGSYPGSLSSWAKLKYPALFVGAVASSAPLQAEANFEQYAQVVGFALADTEIGGSTKCSAAVKAACTEVHNLVTSTQPYGTNASIPKGLRPCTPMATELDLSVYEGAIFGNFQGLVQYNRGRELADVCDTMLSAASPLLGLAKVIGTCVPSSFEKDQIKPLLNTTFNGQSIMRQWIWQSCNEFGFFQTATGANHPFTAFASVNYNTSGLQICKAAYGLGPDYTGPNTHWANTNYGSRQIGGVNITFPNGSADPWHSLSVVNSTDPSFNSCTESPCPKQHLDNTDGLVFMAGTSHCRDMYSPMAADPEDVQWAHARIAARVAHYLA